MGLSSFHLRYLWLSNNVDLKKGTTLMKAPLIEIAVHETLYTDILYKQTGSQIIFPFALFIWDEITPHVSDLNFGNTASWERRYPWTYKSSL